MSGLIFDAQIHTWAAEDASHPWDHQWPLESATAKATFERMAREPAPFDEVVSWMDAVGVQGALLVSHRIYGFDNSYALEAAARFPSRFRAVGLIDPAARDLRETMEAWLARPDTAGFRVAFTGEKDLRAFRAGVYQSFFETAQKLGCPVFVFPPKIVGELAPVARSFPELRLVIDHFGMPQVPYSDANPDPFAGLPSLLELALYDNVMVKATALPFLAAEPFPFPDVWRHLHTVLDAFGIGRVMWGSDATRVVASHSYADAVEYVRQSSELSEAEKGELLGGTLQRLVGWEAP
jgi:L-fuconolactonase